MDKLSKMGINGTGTVWQNRLHRVPIAAKKDVLKKAVDRGFQETISYKGDQVLVCWKDNQPVYVASNKLSAATRFSKTQWKKIQVRFE